MGRHRKPKHLSESEIERFLADARRLLDTNNKMSIRTDSEHYRALAELNHVIVETAKIIAGTDRPWPIFSTVGPC